MNYGPLFFVASVMMFSFDHPIAGIVLMVFAILERKNV